MTELIAEISCNHLQRQETLDDLIDACAISGADSVKFQIWEPDTMAADRQIEGGPWAGKALQDLYRDAYLPWDMAVHGFRRARALGLKPFASVFDHKALDFMERTGCPRYKIASFELLDLPLIEAVAKTGKPMIISTGMGTHEEIQDAVVTARNAGCEDLTLLHCVSAYPAPASSAGLLEMEVMRGRYNCQVGLSDHTLGIGVPIAAAVLGASMIEKHVTLDRNDGGPDAAFSIEPNELRQLVTELSRAKQATAYQPYPRGTDPNEEPQRALRRTLYWAKDIKAGEVITPEHLKTMRPALGAKPAAISLYLGLAATQGHKADHPVTTR